MIDSLIEKFTHKKRYKNGKIITSINNTRVLKSLSTSRKYRYLNTSIKQFSQSKYHRDFTKYRFRDLNEKFLQDFVVWIQVRAAKSGSSGDVSGKLRKLKAVCLYSKEQGVYNVNINAFGSFKEKLKHRITTPKGVSPEIMEQIEAFDRTLLTRNQIKDDMIIYDRTKYDNQVRVIIIDKVAEIIERYHTEAYMNYVFPAIKRCNPTQSKLYGRVKRINETVNETHRKIFECCGM